MRGQILAAVLICSILIMSGIASARQDYILSTTRIGKPFVSGKEKIVFDRPIGNILTGIKDTLDRSPRYFSPAPESRLSQLKTAKNKRLTVSEEQRAWNSLSARTIRDENKIPTKTAKTTFISSRNRRK